MPKFKIGDIISCESDQVSGEYYLYHVDKILAYNTFYSLTVIDAPKPIAGIQMGLIGDTSNGYEITETDSYATLEFDNLVMSAVQTEVSPKFKVGDIISAEDNKSDGEYILYMVSNVLTNGYDLVCVDIKTLDGIQLGDSFTFDKPTVDKQGVLEFINIPAIPVSSTLKLCICPTFELVNFGCKCGGK